MAKEDFTIVRMFGVKASHQKNTPIAPITLEKAANERMVMAKSLNRESRMQPPGCPLWTGFGGKFLFYAILQ